MLPDQSIQPLNVAAATLLVQLFLMALIAVASSLFESRRWPQRVSPMLGRDPIETEELKKSPTLFVALGSFAVLLISDELYSIWSPIFQGVGINTISASKAIALVFGMDLFLVAYLMASSGGSRTSPFVAVLFTIPALAIFLRLPPAHFLSFTGLAIVIYLVMLVETFNRESSRQSAAAFTNIACLLLSMFTGYITRPIPINELVTNPIIEQAPSKAN
jgi:hypothetical protein